MLTTKMILLLFGIITICGAADYSIGCGDVQSGYMGYDGSVTFEFVNSNQQDVFFTNCHSDFDTTFYLYDYRGYEIQDQSTNNCDGDDCSDSSYYCSSSTRESFIMSSLSAGTYELVLAPYSSDYGSWEIEVICGDSIDLINDAPYGEYCNSHDDCSSGDNVFCNVNYDCDWCSECHYCWDGIDDTCGDCGDGYPTMEDDCASNSFDMTYVWILFGIGAFAGLGFYYKRKQHQQSNSVSPNHHQIEPNTANSITTNTAPTTPPAAAGTYSTATQQPIAGVQYVVQPVAFSTS